MEGKHSFEWCVLKLKENIVALTDLSGKSDIWTGNFAVGHLPFQVF